MTPEPATPPESAHSGFGRLHVGSFLGLFCVGVYATAFGPALPFLAERFGVSLDRAGLLVAAAHSAIATTSKDVPHGINRLNLWFAVGAVLGPVWAGAVLVSRGDHTIIFVGVAVISSAVAVLLAAVPRTPRPAHHHGAAGRPRSLTPWVMGAVLFLYVGAEIGLGSWVSSYSREAFAAGVMAGALVAAGYWGALAVGRVITGLLFARGVPPLRVLFESIVGSLVTSSALALADGSLAIGVTAAFGTGLFFGPIWPAAITLASQGSASGAPAAMVTVGNAGGILFPWLQGKVLVAAGPGRGIALTALLCVLMLAVVAAYRQRLAKPTRGDPQYG